MIYKQKQIFHKNMLLMSTYIQVLDIKICVPEPCHKASVMMLTGTPSNFISACR